MTDHDDFKPLQKPPFVEAMNKFEELMTQSGRVFLLGAGASKCAGVPLTAELTEEVLNSKDCQDATKDILKKLKNSFEGSKDANIEDYLSELIDLVAIARRRAERGANVNKITLDGKTHDPDELSRSTEEIKSAIASAINKKASISTHWEFVRLVHKPIRPGLAPSGGAVDYLVLNYDTLIEDALALAKIPFADGLGGGATGWWDESTFDQKGLEARVLKLHGSINWVEMSNDPLPRRLSSNLDMGKETQTQILIWPASTKYRETLRDPFAQVLSIARKSLRPIGRGQKVLVTCGYSFGDSHINLEIDRALRESDGLTVIAFSSDEIPNGKLKEWHDDKSLRDRVLIFCRRGFYHGTKEEKFSEDLPWWKFENVTRILGGER